MFSKKFITGEAIYELNKIVEIEQNINRDNLIYKLGDKKKDKTYDFQKFKKIRSFGIEICNDELALEDPLEEQVAIKNEIDKFKESMKQKALDKQEKKSLTFKNANRFLIRRQNVLNGSESRILSIKTQI